MNDAVNRRTFLRPAACRERRPAWRPAVLGRGRRNLARHSARDKTRRRVACCTYTFRQFTFYEAMDKAKALGRAMSSFPGQSLPRASRRCANETMPDPLRKELRHRLDDSGMRMVSCYLAALPNDPGQVPEYSSSSANRSSGNLRCRAAAGGL